MHKLHSFLFSLFFLATLSCSASEQPITQYNDTQLSTIEIMVRRANSIQQESSHGYTRFLNNANALKNNLKNTDSLSLENNEFRLTMAKSLQSIIKEKVFMDRVRRHMEKIPHTQSYRLDYLNTVRKKLRNIHELTITTEEIEQYIIVVGEIVGQAQPISYDRNTFTDKYAHIYDEIVEELEQHQLRCSAKDTSSSDQNKEAIDCITEFLIITHQEEATKNQENKPTRKTPYIIAGAIAILIAYYCNLHEKLAGLISLY